MLRALCLILGFVLIPLAAGGTTVSPSQYLVADDMVDKPPVQHDIHLQAPNGQQTRVVVLGGAELEYEVEVHVAVKGDAHRHETCTFLLTKEPSAQTPTCFLDFSSQHETKKLNFNQEIPKK